MRFASRAIAAAYAGGIIDGEGSVSTEVKHRAIRVSNTEPAILDAYTEALSVLGVQFTRAERPQRRTRRKDIGVVSIFGRRNLEIMLRDVPLASVAKQNRLALAVASFVLPNYYRKHEVTRERLVALIEEGLTQREIAAALGLRCHSNAQHHLEKHGLRTQRAKVAA